MPHVTLLTDSDLQWGHGEFAVDDHSDGGTMASSRFFLQWGHGEFAVDDKGMGGGEQIDLMAFNGATANSPWMTRPCCWPG